MTQPEARSRDLWAVIGQAVGVFIATPLIMFATTVTISADVPGPQGERYDVGGYSLYLKCSGQGSPTVFLDAGLGSDHTEWSAVQPMVARFTRVCSWDRAGLGKSDPRPERGPVTTARIVAELHTLLQQAGIAAPYVLVGHSLGGIDMRLYEKQYPGQVAGLVMAEGTPEQQELTGTGIETSNGEVMDTRSGAQALERWSLPPDLPLVVIERAKDTDSVWQAEQAALSVRSANSLLVIAENSDHRVEMQQPGLVVAGIETVVYSAANQTALGPCPESITHSAGVCLASGTALPEEGVTVSILMLALVGCIALLLGVGTGLVLGRTFLGTRILADSPRLPFNRGPEQG